MQQAIENFSLKRDKTCLFKGIHVLFESFLWNERKVNGSAIQSSNKKAEY
jgi:hypothetical protein